MGFGHPKQGTIQPFLLSCNLPQTHWNKTPESVSIVDEICNQASNNLRVIYDLPTMEDPKKKFAVCVKGLDFPDDDLSFKMMEWIEVLSALGADKIFLYNLNVHENVAKVKVKCTSVTLHCILF